MAIECGICDRDHGDVEGFVKVHPEEAGKVEKRMQLVRSVWPDAEAEETAAAVVFLRRLESGGFEVRRLHG